MNTNQTETGEGNAPRVQDGKAAYERDVANRSQYHDGTPRKQWAELGEVEQWSWNREQKA